MSRWGDMARIALESERRIGMESAAGDLRGAAASNDSPCLLGFRQ
jgi:hypothetical protein